MSQRLSDIGKDLGIKLLEGALKVADPRLVELVPLGDKIVKVYDLSKEFRRLVFEQKLKEFINNLGQLPPDEINGYIDKMNKSESLKFRVGSTILELDRLDDTRKAEYSAKLFVAYLRSQINEPEYQSLRYALERLYVPDLVELKKFYDKHQSDPNYLGLENSDHALQRLTACGLLVGPVTGLGGVPLFHLNDTGKQFVELALQAETP